MSVAWAQKSLLVLVSIPIQDQEQCQRAWLEDLWFYGFFKECINEVDSADCQTAYRNSTCFCLKMAF